MNRSILSSVLLCSLVLLTVPVKSGWCSSLLNIGRTIQTQIKEHPKVAGCAAVFYATTLGYGVFDKLRNREINKELDARLQEHKENVSANADVHTNFTESISKWGKHCDFEINIDVINSIGCMKVYLNHKLIKVIDLNK